MGKRHYFVTGTITNCPPFFRGREDWTRKYRFQKTIQCKPDDIVSTIIQELKEAEVYISPSFSTLNIETIQPL